VKLLGAAIVVVDPALDRAQRLVRRGLEEVDPDVSGAQLDGDSQPGRRLFGVPDSSARFSTHFKATHQ
jgi:hypothetical protein